MVRDVCWATLEELARGRIYGAITARKDFWAMLEEVVRAGERCGVSRNEAVDILVGIIEARMKQAFKRPGHSPVPPVGP